MAPEKKVAVSAVKSGPPLSSGAQPAVPPIITKSRGVAYNVQGRYAGWSKGLRKP